MQNFHFHTLYIKLCLKKKKKRSQDHWSFHIFKSILIAVMQWSNTKTNPALVFLYTWPLWAGLKFNQTSLKTYSHHLQLENRNDVYFWIIVHGCLLPSSDYILNKIQCVRVCAAWIRVRACCGTCQAKKSLFIWPMSYFNQVNLDYKHACKFFTHAHTHTSGYKHKFTPLSLAVYYRWHFLKIYMRK